MLLITSACSSGARRDTLCHTSPGTDKGVFADSGAAGQGRPGPEFHRDLLRGIPLSPGRR